MKQSAKRLLPDPVLSAVRSVRSAAMARRDARMTPRGVFTAVYASSAWGGPAGQIWSGSGSHDPAVVEPYVVAVRERVTQSHPTDRTRLVDLGCGDSAVGSQLAGLGGTYVACDVVPDVIDHDREQFAHLGVEFRNLDIVSDPLPDGDVAFLRQVLQHLSNDQIVEVLTKLHIYSTVFITEHYPSDDDFSTSNLDKVHGSGTRVVRGSGVFLSEPPFSLPAESLRLLVEAPAPPLTDQQSPGWIRTFEYAPGQS